MMGQVVYLGLCLLGCFLLGSSSTPVEDASAEDAAAESLPVASDEKVAAKSACPPGALYIRGNCFEFFGTLMSWDSAEEECQQMRRGGHLASYSSPKEEKMVSDYIRRSSSTYNAWTGLYAVPNFNTLTWEWSDSSPYVSGRPLWDNRSPSTSISSLECVVLHNIRSPSSSYRWTQVNCENHYPFVCKYKPYY